ncbi:FtsW/RodA/SpoVE family cell cycle protein [Fictibacillus sp. Mic-4]|uniref:FtsW/RodA/SpoVE family cell cycle protein n=1 Tax=Fictibacillus TaxID=1329200 RepID=UPI000412542A|nr:FtsW/RodA/SpoVE family cell cycle protein [Fictibacillus gelatini]
MIKKMFKYYDYSLIVAILTVCGFGLIMVYSASSIYGLIRYGVSSDYFFMKQLIFFIVGLICCLVTMIVPFHIYKGWLKFIVFGSIIVLGSVFLFGKVSNNAQSWLKFGLLGVQPSEFVKLGMIIYLSAIFSKKQDRLDHFGTSVVPPLIIFAVVFILIYLQPDLGTALILAGITGIIVLCSGLRKRHILLLLAFTLGMMLLGSQFLSNNQKMRFAGAYHPFEHKSKWGYQLIQSYVAMASGGINGKGLGEGIQKYGYLPEPHTDFIIAVVAEELGFWGVLFVISLLAFIVIKGFIIGIRCKDIYGSLLAFGISGMIGIQTVVNLGAASGLLPITGVTLPFISYGGSSLILSLLSVGILINISCYVNHKRKKDRLESPAIQKPYLVTKAK